MAHVRTAGRSGFVFRGGRRVRETSWFPLQTGQTTIVAGSTATLIASLNAVALALRPFTIVRTRGHLFLRSDQEAADESYDVSYGMGIVTDQAVAIGVTAIPTPFTDMDSQQWFVYEELAGHVGFSSAVGIRDYGHGKDFDSKAMRKVEAGQDLIVVAETSAVSNGIVLLDQARILVKLH